MPQRPPEPEVPPCPDLPPELHYADDSEPGIRRRLQRGKFVYFSAQGERIKDAQEIARLNKLAIPPAYRDVWICPDPCGHLQATGRDARGRKQYRYHPRWREIRDEDKYARLLAFGQALPTLRATVDAHLSQPGMGRDKVTATVVALLDATLIRVGNSRYARDNKSFGLTTLRNRHVQVKSGAIRFHFRGKSGVEHQLSIDSPRLARIVKRCQALAGQHLFQYLDDEGQRHTLSSTDINDYLRNHAGNAFTAKDYRTWAGTALALDALRQCAPGDSRTQIAGVVAAVAQELGNTPAVCRKCYIHPGVLEAFEAGALQALKRPRARKWLKPEEVALLEFLEAQPSA